MIKDIPIYYMHEDENHWIGEVTLTDEAYHRILTRAGNTPPMYTTFNDIKCFVLSKHNNLTMRFV